MSETFTSRLIQRAKTGDRTAARILSAARQRIPPWECVQTPRGHREPSVLAKVREKIMRDHLGKQPK